jgi:arginyl-tRNA synthetase
LYAFHDLAFAKLVGPTHYITGAEQKEHFASLGLGDKHLPMGLVLGSDGKKLKSRASKEGVPADSPKAEAIMEEVMENLEDSCPDKRKLAWNVLAWNFLTVARTQNVKYNPADWTKADAPGLYITYTFARVKKAARGKAGITSRLTR